VIDAWLVLLRKCDVGGQSALLELEFPLKVSMSVLLGGVKFIEELLRETVHFPAQAAVAEG